MAKRLVAKLTWNGPKYIKKVQRNMKKAVEYGSVYMAEAFRERLSHPGTGRFYYRYGYWHQASRPGEPPAPWTTRLLNSIGHITSFSHRQISEVQPPAKTVDGIGKPYSFNPNIVIGASGTNCYYGRDLEFGLGVGQRPFFRSTIEAKRQSLINAVGKELRAD